MVVTYHLLSDKGSRANNEDRVGSYEKNNEYCFVLADGLGGHEKGEVASRLVVDEAIERFKTTGFDEFFLRDSFEIGQEKLLELQKKTLKSDDYKTTMVVLAIKDNQVSWGHVGDSRLYLFKNKKYVSHTLDHSVPQILVNIGEIEDKDIRNHPDRSHLLKSMGIEWERPAYEISDLVELEKGMAFLICSDGFWELIDEENMQKCLKKANNVHDWVNNMEKIVRKNGEGTNMDNFSAIGVFIK